MRHIKLSDADSRRGNGSWSTNDLPLGDGSTLRGGHAAW
jgi:hypothetical protein